MSFRFRTEPHLEDEESRLLHTLRADLRSVHVATAEGERHSTTAVRDAMTSALERRGFSYDSSHGAFTNSKGVALTVHGGRAFQNNEVVWRLLQLAGVPQIHAHIAVVPLSYKNSACAAKVADQLAELSDNAGVAVDMEWAAQIAYRI